MILSKGSTMFRRLTCFIVSSLILTAGIHADEASDFNGDSAWNTADLDQLNAAIEDGSTNLAFDLNSDGSVDMSDRDTWLASAAAANGFAGPYLVGDINLDGTVNVLGDAFTLVENLLSSTSNWSDGDLNADGQVNVLGDAFALIANLNRTNTDIIALFSANTQLEAPTSIETPDALITRFADRARDRHAREGNFEAYDHYLSWYWEQRMMTVEIIDRVGRNGGNDITFNYTTQRPLNPAEFRTFFRGITTVAEYNINQIATFVSSNPSDIPGEIDYHYTATVDRNGQFNRPLQLGDRVEMEISQFLLAPRNGRTNYYGTTMLYVVGEGIVPWGTSEDLGIPVTTPANINHALDSHPLPSEALLGGLTTLHRQYSAEPDNAFKQIATNLAPINGYTFMLGRRLHHTDFGNGNHSEAGNPRFAEHVGKLGSKYIARSCVACHVNNGRAIPPAIGNPLNRFVVKVGSNPAGSPDPTLGSVLQPRSTSGAGEGQASIGSYTMINGSYADGTVYSLRKPNYAFTGSSPSHHSARVAPALIGMGLLEAIREIDLSALADPDDADGDGISGRTQILTDPTTGEQRVGRFGYKAGTITVSDQVASALNTDLGVATSVFPIFDGETSASSVEIDDEELKQMTRYVALLGVQSRRNLDSPLALQGEALFTTAGCAKCHTTEFTTSQYHQMTEVRSQKIHPYTDLLLHDMGSGLADNMGEGVATGAEWRTAPLWNIGQTAGVNVSGEAYLHDGRARTLAEAILWHGGEGEAAKESFRTMSAAVSNLTQA
jgi:CxxC motif-containing protein (DUF1111 family)